MKIKVGGGEDVASKTTIINSSRNPSCTCCHYRYRLLRWASAAIVVRILVTDVHHEVDIQKNG